MTMENVRIFALASSRDFGEGVAGHLGVPLSDHEERDFEDGEHKARPRVNVRGKDVFVIQSLYGESGQSVNDKLCRLLFFIGALNDASAERITAVIPYLCYARKDRKTKPRDPVTTRYLAQLFEAVGTRRVLTMDVHNLAAFQNAFRCNTDHLEARKLFVDYFAPLLGDQEATVVSPDVGGVKRAEAFRKALGARTNREVASAFMEKHRSRGVVTGEHMVGDVNNKSAIIIDDLISTGTTLSRAAQACRNSGARRVYAAAAHGLFVGGAEVLFTDVSIDHVVVTDTVPPFRLSPQAIKDRLTVVGAAGLFAEAIRRIHEGGSIVDLLEP
jgi:ribose-phosphate pyrophosphokinase